MNNIEENFSDFMQQALYGEKGFYTLGGGAGRSRDYLTSVEVGDLFAYVMASYIDSWFESLENAEKAIVIDAGCGPGSLVAGIARAGLRNAEFIDFYLVDISPSHRKTALDKVTNAKPRFNFDVLEALPECDVPTLVIANELIDNLVFDISTTHEIYNPEIPHGEYLGPAPFVYGVMKSQDFIAEANVSREISDFKIPVHVGFEAWLDELIEKTSQVSSLTLLFFDYMKKVEEFEDGNWLRLYSDNKRIVGVEKVLEALQSGAAGDITCDVISGDLLVLLDSEGFSKLNIEKQSTWLIKNDVDVFCSTYSSESAYDQLAQFAKGNQIDKGSSFIKEREILLDENGLGAFSVLSAKREI